MQLFYEPDILTNGGLLSPEESAHCIRVLRHHSGDSIQIMDGKGHLFEGTIVVASPKACSVKINGQKSQSPASVQCHIAIAPTKNIDRTEWFLEKSTEIGIEWITPIVVKNSERKTIKPPRLEKVITSAIKQSGSYWRPTLKGLTPFNEFIKTPFDGDKFIAHCHNGHEPHLKNVLQKGRNALVLIGPEGDFSRRK
ncbi:ribosomal RNA small subunit methyltransferase E [Geofilum rubicundum JCM 15548]|uniref:16S rRNA (uracil(1498)-N(3))-methyltransferase n=1 Tax=Geofilum rubicundum JCM 15548 TaxID=1236989 RepID=A0A0E9LTS7_9BACT|nr:RsmE family RNA methyltransferase [Geofilum rubicundum]GAO28664.1 ribosomal RNA small subunit methyltransferase E [Geofilum rubicundum JCM 15548]